MARCFDCGEQVTGYRLYCGPACRQGFHNRMSKRGRVIMPYALGWRMKRGTGDPAKYAFGELTAYLDHCNAEDRAAGRPPMIDYIERVKGGAFTGGWGWRETASPARKAGTNACDSLPTPA